MVEVRRAVVADAGAIAAVHVRAWQEAYVGQVSQSYLDGLSIEGRLATWPGLLTRADAPEVLVAVLDDEVVAFMTVAASRDDDLDGTVGEVPAIYARERVWGTGVGRQLMDEGLRRLTEAGFVGAILWVLESNERARRFYEAGGWRWDGTTKTIPIGGEDLVELRYRRSLP